MEINEFSGCKERGKLDEGGGEGECKMQGDKAKNRDKLGRETAGKTERIPVIVHLYNPILLTLLTLVFNFHCNAKVHYSIIYVRHARVMVRKYRSF